MEREPSEEEPDSPDKASTSRAKSGSNEESQSVVVAEAVRSFLACLFCSRVLSYHPLVSMHVLRNEAIPFRFAIGIRPNVHPRVATGRSHARAQVR